MNDKKVGRPRGKLYPVRKEILLTPELEKNWDPDKIRMFLKGNFKILYDVLVKMQLKEPISNEEIEKIEELEVLFESE